MTKTENFKGLKLTKESIKALRNANSLVFRTSSKVDSETHSEIQVTQDADYDKGRMEHVFTIPCESNYSKNTDTYDCCCVLLCVAFHDEWKTIASLLRPDDIIYLNFGRGLYGNCTTKELNLSGDAFRVVIRRYNKRYRIHDNKYTFLLDVETTKADSRTRMIRNKKEVVSAFD